MMWIRSQNKEVLIKATKVVYVGEAGILGNDEGNETFTILGEYSTKEKALKVLDMIQGLILYTYYGGNEPKKLFQMPQDSEVE